MNKTLEQWALVDPKLCSSQNSVAANEFLIADAKKDIAELGRLLNSSVSEFNDTAIADRVMRVIKEQR